MNEATSRKKASEFLNTFNIDVAPARNIYEPIWEQSLNTYNMVPIQQDEEFKSNLTTPKTKAMVDTWISTNFSMPPKTRAIARNESGTEQASAVSQLMEYAFAKARNRLGLWDFGWHLALYGTAFAFLPWRHKTVERIKRVVHVDMNGVQEVEELKTFEVVEDFPEIESVSVWDIWCDPKAVFIDDFRFIYRRRVYSDEDSFNAYMDYIGAKLPSGVKYDNILTGEGNSSANTSVGQSDKAGRFYVSDKNEIEVYEKWSENGKLEIVAGQYMIYDGRSPFDHGEIPFVMDAINRNGGETYGRGIPELYKPIQDALDNEMNIAMDNLEFASYPMLLTRTNSRVAMYANIFETGVGAILEDDTPGDTQPLSFSSRASEHFQMFSVLERLGSEALSISAPMMGQVAPGTSKTATGITAMIDMGMAPARLQQQKFDVAFLRRVFRQFYMLFRQYMPEDYIITIIDDKDEASAIKMSRDSISFDFDFEPEAGSMNYVDKASSRATWIQLLQILGNPAFSQTILQTSGKKVELDKVIEQVLEAFGVKNKKEFITVDRQFLQKAMQQAQLQQAQAQLQGAQPQPGGNPPVPPGMGAPQ